MAEDQAVNVIPLAYSFTDPMTQRKVQVKMSIVDGSCQGIYNDRGVAKKIYQTMKKQGEKVVFLERKNILIEAHEGKTAQQIRDYILAMIKKMDTKSSVKIEGLS